jgi:hypothetical protein
MCAERSSYGASVCGPDWVLGFEADSAHHFVKISAAAKKNACGAKSLPSA